MDESYVIFRLEAVYYHTARKYLQQAQRNYSPLKKVIDEITKIDKTIIEIESKYENRIDAYDEVESYCIQLDSFYSEMEEKYLPVIRDIALVHILNIQCLESVINVIASEKIKPKSLFDDFDKLSLEGKWLFFPKFMGMKDTFDKGIEPFQSFKKIVRWRNALVHFKGKRDSWRGYLPPKFFDKLGLEIQCVEKSCNTTTTMIKKLCEICNFSEPNWLTKQYWNLFELKF